MNFSYCLILKYPFPLILYIKKKIRKKIVGRNQPPCGFSISDLFQPLLFNTLQVRNALGAAQKRKLSFKNVSNVVVQLIHSIKYSMEVPFSNMAAVQEHKPQSRKVSDTIEFLFYNGLFVFAWKCFLLCVRYLILEWYGRL